MTNSTKPATVKDAAAAIRRDLRAAFPDTRFSVRMGTGTASAYIDAAWTDGPTEDMVRNVTDPYWPHHTFGSPVQGVSLDRLISKATLIAAQEKIRAALPGFEVYDADGRYASDGGHCPVFHLGGWRFGGGSAVAALQQVADLLILKAQEGYETASRVWRDACRSLDGDAEGA